MKRAGILFGRENTFPTALVDRINGANVDVHAEWIKVGAPRCGSSSGYDLILDRVSREVPFFVPFLRNAAMSGSIVLNDPLRSSADDRFVHLAVAAGLGMRTPRAVLLPSKLHPPQATAQSMRNLEYPLGWKEIFAYVGFPAVLLPVQGALPRKKSPVYNEAEFFAAYDATGDTLMLLQQAFPAHESVHCYCVGQKQTRVLPRDGSALPLPADIHEEIAAQTVDLTHALGLQMNAVEFALREDGPIVVEACDPVPDAEYYSVGPEHFTWFVDAVAELVVSRALHPGRRRSTPGRAASSAGPKRTQVRDTNRKKRT